jgi:DNA helicase-2/ATP-dependent DNA helicase PcrA
MCLRADNTVILAAAGSRKTESIVEAALAVTSGRVLITTFTNENQRQIVNRIEQKAGALPPQISVCGWFSFLIQQCSKPYQRVLTGEPLVISGLNFKGQRNRFTSKTSIHYFLDGNGAMYRDGVSDFVVELNKRSGGAVVRRLERVYTHVFIDEVQDLVGYDLDVLDLLIASNIKLLMVGDPRQHTFATNLGPRNKKYQGAGLADWFQERSEICTMEQRNYSYRSSQAICDFADAIYPDFPPTASIDVPLTGHDGVFQVEAGSVPAYMAKYGHVTALRYDKNAWTADLRAINIGVAKGSTFDRVMIFPTMPMLRYLEDGKHAALKSPEKLYVAVTRARFSVAFVVPRVLPSARLPLFSG